MCGCTLSRGSQTLSPTLCQFARWPASVSDLKRKLRGKARGERTGAALAARLWDPSETLAISQQESQTSAKTLDKLPNRESRTLNKRP